MTPPHGQWVRAWNPPVPGIREVFHAYFVDHAYPGHTHDTWTVLVVDDGDIRYDLDRQRHGSAGSVVTVLPPHVVHDGRPGPSGHFRKKVLYLDERHLGYEMIGRAVDGPSITDRPLRASLDALHRQLLDLDDPVAAETRLVFIAARLGQHLARRADHQPGTSHAVADHAREVLDSRSPARVTLAELGAQLHVEPTHLVRSFTKRFGISPHAYLMGRRIDAARRQLLDGRPPGTVATDLGFYDQAHLTRHFKRHVGTTPGRYQRTGF